VSHFEEIVGVAAGIVAVAVLALDVVTTRQLWKSEAFDRVQKIAQTALLWLVPGGAMLVRYFLREPHKSQRSWASDNEAMRTVDEFPHDGDPGGGQTIR
jgi:hypothetical protein